LRHLVNAPGSPAHQRHATTAPWAGGTRMMDHDEELLNPAPMRRRCQDGRPRI
jgi:hypothetical protein